MVQKNEPEKKGPHPIPFPWKQMMQFGFGVLRLSPQAFWSMSLPELNAALEAWRGDVPQPVTRQWLNETMRKHPDHSGMK